MPPSRDVPLVFTIDEVAERLHLHPQTVRGKIARGELGSVKLDADRRGRRLVRGDQLAAYIEAHTVDALDGAEAG